MANLPTKIPFVFSNTGVELNAILDFVKNYEYDNVQIIKPSKPFPIILKEYGKPTISKLKSDMLETYQRNKDYELTKVRSQYLISGGSNFKLANRDIHIMHPDNNIKYSSKCCNLLKKKPFKQYEKENDMRGSFVGIRLAEGGARSFAYNSCVSIKKVCGSEYYKSMPIFDWTDEMMNEFVEKYHINLSIAYTDYGFTSTGCIGCPYSKNLKDDLIAIHKYEPIKYKACMKWFKDVYIQQQVVLDFDTEYMKEFEDFQPTLRQRNKEMMDKYRRKDNQSW